MVRRVLHLSLLLSLATGIAAWAQLPGTLFGQVFDENEEAVEGVTITITNPEMPDFEQVESTDSRGRYRIFVANSLPQYTLEFKKEGYQSFTMPGVKIPARQRTRRNFTMRSQEAALAQMRAEGQLPEGEEAEEAAGGGLVKTYNEGVQALQVGDLGTAASRFEQVLEKQPENGAAHGGMARVYWKQEKWPQALEHAEKSVELNPEDTEINQVLYAAYSALGQQDKADEILAEMQALDPEKAGLNLYNRAADLYNAGQLAEAKQIFEAILQAQPDHAKTHYMLGLCYVSEGANDKAKEHLNRFLELAPNDPDATTAQEMLNYIE